MKSKVKSKKLNLTFYFCILTFLLTNCAYFNTFYNAQNYYAQGKKLVVNDTLKFDSEFFDKTIEKTTIVIVKYPNSRWVDDALFLMGASYYYKGDYVRALEKLELFCANYPQSKFYCEVCYYRGLSYYQQQKFSSAIVALNEAMALKPLRKKSSIILCYLHNKNGDYKSLIETGEGLLKESLNLAEKKDVLNLIGKAQFNLKLYDEALATFNIILSISRTTEEKKNLKLNIAKIYLQMDKYDECRTFLAGEGAIEFKSLLANLNVKVGDIQSAKDIYREITTLEQPEFSSLAYYELGQLNEEEDSLENAIAYYDSSSSKSSGEYSLKAKRRADILKKIVSLSKETENVDRAQFLLAEIYFVDLEDLSKALSAYKNVYQNFPTSEWAPKARYAQFWITKNLIKDDSLAKVLAIDLMNKYPKTEYAISAENILGTDTNGTNKNE